MCSCENVTANQKLDWDVCQKGTKHYRLRSYQNPEGSRRVDELMLIVWCKLLLKSCTAEFSSAFRAVFVDRFLQGALWLW